MHEIIFGLGYTPNLNGEAFYDDASSVSLSERERREGGTYLITLSASGLPCFDLVTYKVPRSRRPRHFAFAVSTLKCLRRYCPLTLNSFWWLQNPNKI